MNENAANRTPVEIWRHILHLAVRWPLFPSEDDPDLKKIAFFRRGCALYHQYIEVISIRGKLCRVCRSWAAIMDEIVDSLAIIGRGDQESWPSSELIPVSSCIIHPPLNHFCFCTVPFGDMTNRWNENLLIPSTQFVLYELPRLFNTQLQKGSIVEALLLGVHADHMAHLVRCSTRLKALHWNYNSGRGPISIQDITVHRGLTHLRITDLRACNVKDVVNLPHLKHLEIGLSEISRDLIPNHFISSWKMPMLAILMIKGWAIQTTIDDINRFLAGSPAKLHIIIFTFGGYYPVPQWIPPLNILTLLPKLTLLGVDLCWFRRKEAIQLYSKMKRSRKCLPNILIADFSVHPSAWLGYRGNQAIDIVRWWKFQSGSVEYITIDKSWRELAQDTWTSGRSSYNLSGTGVAVKSFFKELLKGDVRLCDSNGDMLGDSESQEFMLGVVKGDFQTKFLHPYSK